MVICSNEPPSFWVTTAAAVAQGEMTHIRMDSISMRLLPVMCPPTISAMSSPMNNSWKRPTQKCQPTGRSWWKSTLQNVTNSTRNIKSGRMAAKNGAIVVPASSNWGVKAKSRYNAAPAPMLTGSVQSLMNLMISMRLYIDVLVPMCKNTNYFAGFVDMFGIISYLCTLLIVGDNMEIIRS